jgi:hypothetical protein
VTAPAGGRPYSIDEIRVHGPNPSGSTAIKLELQQAGYRVNRDYDLTTLRRSAREPRSYPAASSISAEMTMAAETAPGSGLPSARSPR